jgi:hypothetical protein
MNTPFEAKVLILNKAETLAGRNIGFGRAPTLDRALPDARTICSLKGRPSSMSPQLLNVLIPSFLSYSKQFLQR